MRIISGTIKGKILNTPINQNTRPTSDKARQAIFNILEHADWANGILGNSFLDVFAGTGAFGLEALSRGASHAAFIENDRQALAILKNNIAICRFENKSKIIAIDALKLNGKSAKFDIIFMDPPYEKGLLIPSLIRLEANGYFDENSIIILEHHKNEAIEFPPNYEILKQVNYGINGISFISIKSQDPEYPCHQSNV